MMSKRLWLINLLLFFSLILLTMKVYDVWTREGTTKVGTVGSKAKPASVPLPLTVAGKKEAVPAKGFQSISEKNLFSPDRKEFPIMASPNGRKGPGRPNIVLYGVTLGEDFQMALVTNPARRPERGERETMSVKVGDKVGEYQVAKISADRITLENEADSFDVLLYDPSQPKKRPVQPIAPPVVRPTPSPPTAPTPATASPRTPPRPMTPSPGISQPSLPPPPGSPGVSQSPSPSPTVRPPASRNLLRQRRVPVPAPVSPRTPVTPELEEEEDDEDEE